MSSLTLTVANSDFSGVGLGKFNPLPSLGGRLYAGYIFGTGYGATPLKDLSGNGRDLTSTGGIFTAEGLIASPTSFVTTPFTGNQLVAGAGACSILAVVSPTVGQGSMTAVSMQYQGSTPKAGISLTRSGSPTQPQTLYSYDGSTAVYTQLTSSVPPDGAPEFSAATFSASTLRNYRRRPSFSAAETSTNATLNNTGGVNPFRIGADWATLAPGTSKIQAIMFAQGELSLADLDAAYAETKGLMAALGISI